MPSPLQVKLHAIATRRRVRLATPPTPRPFTPRTKQQLKALRAAEMAAWEAASVRQAAPVTPPAQATTPRLPGGQRSLGRGEKVACGILAGVSLAALLVALNYGIAAVAHWENLVAWVRMALL